MEKEEEEEEEEGDARLNGVDVVAKRQFTRRIFLSIRSHSFLSLSLSLYVFLFLHREIDISSKTEDRVIVKRSRGILRKAQRCLEPDSVINYQQVSRSFGAERLTIPG